MKITLKQLTDSDKICASAHEMHTSSRFFFPPFSGAPWAPGFGKKTKHNYQILQRFDYFQQFNVPVLAGVSRKSMIYKVLETTPEEALNGTTVLHTIALLKNAQLLRVHDVKEAKECIRLLAQLH